MDRDRHVNVLLIEDRDEDADFIRTVLDRHSPGRFHLIRESRLKDGISRLNSGGIDIVLLDFSLPDSLGIETFRRLHDACPTTPVVVLTSLEDDQLAVEAVGDGAQDYLVKRHVDGRLLTRSIRYAIERKRSEEALRESEQRYALAVRGANDGLWDWDLTTGELYVSPRWKSMLGYQGIEIGDTIEGFFGRVHPDDLPHLEVVFESHARGADEHFEYEHRMLTADGDVKWVLTRGVAVGDGSGRTIRMAGSQTDITARKHAEQQLQHDAFHDGLTGLANRALFVDRLAMAIASAQRNSTLPFAVLFFDLDRFKNINDSLGHSVGDHVLQRTAQRLVQFLRPGDTVARLGGDEFAILLTRVEDVTGAIHVAERVMHVVSKRMTINGHDVFVTASVGIALSTTSAANPDGILRDADIAMYRAKAAGKARYEVFDRDMHVNAVRLLRLETDLRRSVERGDFVMHYQPIVSLESGRIVGFEGLVRWQHPERGLVAPAQFIAVAEETGLIVPMGWWVLRESCQQANRWQRRFPANPPLYISVNVSGKLFRNADATDRLVAILTETQLMPETLRLEVTENVVMDHGEEVLGRLAEIRAMGVQLSIDDFGTGYSSLSYLQRFHYDELKIDRSFVSEMGGAGDSHTIVETILALADSLGIGVIAEGVETADQVAKLRKMRCPHGQGFWFARPMDPASATDLIASAPSW